MGWGLEVGLGRCMHVPRVVWRLRDVVRGLGPFLALPCGQGASRGMVHAKTGHRCTQGGVAGGRMDVSLPQRNKRDAGPDLAVRAFFFVL